MSNLGKSRFDTKRIRGAEMHILPTFGKKRIFEDWILAIDCWFRKLDRRPISEVSGQMIAMLEMSDKTNGRGAGDLIFRKLSYRMGGKS